MLVESCFAVGLRKLFLLLLQVGKSYSSAREAIIMTGGFLLDQLQGLDNAAGGKATFAYSTTPFVNLLRAEVSALACYSVQR